ncbi:MAG TPA: aldehyde dehydrogenase family protein, partial [Gemmataceae bacterium]|nr:aldehyde dehydrogenase family protein [Gemmataceae bacterium]
MATATAPSTGTYRQLYIDGQWVDATGGKRQNVTNPATEEAIAEVAFGTRADCQRAIAAAAAAMPGWAKQTSWDRAKVLKKTADLMRERADGIARTLTMEQGKPVAEAKAEVLHSADTFEW